MEIKTWVKRLDRTNVVADRSYKGLASAYFPIKLVLKCNPLGMCYDKKMSMVLFVCTYIQLTTYANSGENDSRQPTDRTLQHHQDLNTV